MDDYFIIKRSIWAFDNQKLNLTTILYGERNRFSIEPLLLMRAVDKRIFFYSVIQSFAFSSSKHSESNKFQMIISIYVLHCYFRPIKNFKGLGMRTHRLAFNNFNSITVKRFKRLNDKIYACGPAPARVHFMHSKSDWIHVEIDITMTKKCVLRIFFMVL